MDERGPQPPLRSTPPKDPLDRAVAGGGTRTDEESMGGVEVVASSDAAARRTEEAVEQAWGADPSLNAGSESRRSGGNSSASGLNAHAHAVADGIDNVVNMLHEAAGQLQGQEQAGIAQMLHEGATGLERLSSTLREQDADALMQQARDYARQRPALVVGGAAAVGFLLGRMLAPRRPGSRD